MKYEELMKLKDEFRKNEQEVKNMEIVLNGFRELIKAEEKYLDKVDDKNDKKLLKEDIKDKKEELKDMEEQYELVKDIFTINKARFNDILKTVDEEALKEEWLNNAVQELLERDRNNVC